MWKAWKPRDHWIKLRLKKCSKDYSNVLLTVKHFLTAFCHAFHEHNRHFSTMVQILRTAWNHNHNRHISTCNSQHFISDIVPSSLDVNNFSILQLPRCSSYVDFTSSCVTTRALTLPVLTSQPFVLSTLSYHLQYSAVESHQLWSLHRTLPPCSLNCYDK